MIQIRLFGSPRVLKDGQPVHIPRRQTRALFFYLAAQAQPISRTRLADLFWPDFSEDEARPKLRDHLSKLRDGLKLTFPDEIQLIVQTQNEMVWLDAERTHVDYLEFQKLFASLGGKGTRLPNVQRMNAAQYQVMKQMIALWGGNEFLSAYDLPYSEALEEWRSQMAAEVNHQVLTVLNRLAEHDRSNGDFENAIHWLLQATRIDQFNPQLHAQIIESYLGSGVQSQARQYYERIRQVWEKEFGDWPSTLAALEKQVYKPAPHFLKTIDNRWPIRVSARVPFVGQHKILNTISKEWNVGSSVLLLGEAGSGKTRIVEEAFNRISPAPRLLLGACQPLNTNMPFAPWLSMLRHSVQVSEWQELNVNWARTLVVLLPELASLRDDIEPDRNEKPEFSRSVLIEAIHQILKILAANGSLFVFLDDVQWADDASLAVISHLLSQGFFDPGRCLLMMAARIEERNPLLDTLLVTNAAQKIVQLQVPALELEEISEMADTLLEHSLPEAFLERLDRDTGGNPLFLLEILQLLIDKGQANNLSEIETLPLPHSVHELIQQKLNRLDANVRELLSTAALMGSQFQLEVLENATHFIPDVTFHAIETLEKMRLLQHIPAQTLTYGFPHEKIRESLVMEITTIRKRHYHKNIAIALEKYLGEQTAPHAATLALHYEEAGNFQRAFHYWEQAGRYAHRLSSFHESMNAFQRAERLITRTPSLTEQELYSMYSTWNDTLFQHDQPLALKRVNKALLAFGEERQSPLLIGTALSGMSDAYMAENNFEAALKSVQKGLGYVQKSGNEYEMARTLDRIGVYHYMLNQLSESQQFFQQSLAISKDSIDPHMILQRSGTYYQLAITAAVGGYPLEGIEYAQHALEDSIYASHPYGQVLAYTVMGLAYYTMGEYEVGRSACKKGMSFEHIQAWRMIGYLSSYYAMNSAEMGRLGEAWHYSQKAIEIGRQNHHGEVAGLGYKAIGDIYSRLGALPQATKAYQQGLTSAGEHFVALENMHRLGYTLYKQGQTALGKGYLEQALELSSQGGMWSIYFLGLINQLEILASEKQFQNFHEMSDWFSQQSIARVREDMAQFTKKRLMLALSLQNEEWSQALELAETILPWYQGKNILWRELETLKAIEKARRCLGLETSQVEENIRQLLGHVEENIGDAPMQEFFDKFKQQMLAK